MERALQNIAGRNGNRGRKKEHKREDKVERR